MLSAEESCYSIEDASIGSVVFTTQGGGNPLDPSAGGLRPPCIPCPVTLALTNRQRGRNRGFQLSELARFSPYSGDCAPHSSVLAMLFPIRWGCAPLYPPRGVVLLLSCKRPSRPRASASRACNFSNSNLLDWGRGMHGTTQSEPSWQAHA
jgi:hypothetical protein